jgi:hypothetical protein
MQCSNELSTPLANLDKQPLVPGTTIQEHYDNWGLPQSVPVVCFYNGEPTLRADWDTIVGEEDQLGFMVLPLGGDAEGKSILRTVAMIAVTVAAFALMPANPAWYHYAAQMAAITAGSFLVNELIPMPTEDPSTQEKKSEGLSPTYSVSARGNRARLGDPVSKIYGTFKYFPDYVSTPFSEYENNYQVLYQHFSLGAGSSEIRSLAFGDITYWEDGSLTGELEDVEVEFVPAGEFSELIPDTITTSQNVSNLDFDFRYCASYVDVTVPGASRITLNTDPKQPLTGSQHNFSVFNVGDTVRLRNFDASSPSANGDGSTYEVTYVDPSNEYIEIDGVLTPETEAQLVVDIDRPDRYVGWFPACNADETIDTVRLTVVLPRGNYKISADGSIGENVTQYTVYARSIDTNGNPDGVHTTQSESYTVTEVSNKPIYKTHEIEVPNARWEVRIVREDPTLSLQDSRYGDATVWQSLGGRAASSVSLPIDTLAVKIRATNQLAQSVSTKMSAVQQSLTPVWDAEDGWSEQPTNNPVWAAVDMLRNSEYGAGVDDANLDLDTFVYYANLADLAGDEFNAVIDRKLSVWECVNYALRVMRSQPIMLGSTFSMIRDEPKSVASAVFTPRNIVKDSFNIEYDLTGDDSPDHVIIEFLNELTDYTVREKICQLSEDDDTPARVRLFGVTKEPQAFREGMYQARANKYRRTTINFKTELDGRVLLRGDKILVSHDMPQWGQSSEVFAYDSGTRTLTVRDELVFADGEAHVIALRKPDGSEWGPVGAVAVHGSPLQVILDEDDVNAQSESVDSVLTINDVAKEPTKVVFGTVDTYAKPFTVLAVRPDGTEAVSVRAANYAPEIYEADEYTQDEESGGSSERASAPTVDDLVVSQTGGGTTAPIELNAAWTAAGNASFYGLDYSYDNATWINAYEGTNTNATFTTGTGTIYFRVAGYGDVRGPYAYYQDSFGLSLSSPSGPGIANTNYDQDSGNLTVSWDSDDSAAYYQVTIGDGTTSLTVTTTSPAYTFSASQVADAGGPWSVYEVDVASVNSAGSSAPTTAGGTMTVPAPSSVSIENDWEGPEHSIVASWEPTPQADAYTVQLYLGGVLQDTFTVYTPYIVIPAQLVDEYTIARAAQIRVSVDAGTITTGISTDTVTDTAPAVPTNITTSSPSAGQLTVSWDANTDDDFREYRLYASGSSGFTPSASTLAYSGTDTSVTVYGLTSASTMYMQLVAVDYIEGGLNYSTEFSQVIT